MSSSNKAPSFGKKVTPAGASAPELQEPTGKVGDTSLAAESIRSGGEFSSNPASRFKSTEVSASNNSQGSSASAPASSSSSSVGGGKPHGKNLKEGGFQGTGTGEGPLPEPGSIEDPGRMGLNKSQSGGGRGSGKKVGGEGMFAGLSNDESA
ncbi:hypothetical protein QBC42DRAFT_259014 [Cladorrhinum samala]|uniref:Uncharacterized protein n=1 Tax=Cladorrhinum samala TaxID=585594 RepID=A0AAV9I0B7_9PEZI|nr:hypothetical protein QBC42DRAFT_259014 [Cladorrhinum samala]